MFVSWPEEESVPSIHKLAFSAIAENLYCNSKGWLLTDPPSAPLLIWAQKALTFLWHFTSHPHFMEVKGPGYRPSDQYSVSSSSCRVPLRRGNVCNHISAAYHICLNIDGLWLCCGYYRAVLFTLQLENKPDMIHVKEGLWTCENIFEFIYFTALLCIQNSHLICGEEMDNQLSRNLFKLFPGPLNSITILFISMG